MKRFCFLPVALLMFALAASNTALAQQASSTELKAPPAPMMPRLSHDLPDARLMMSGQLAPAVVIMNGKDIGGPNVSIGTPFVVTNTSESPLPAPIPVYCPSRCYLDIITSAGFQDLSAGSTIATAVGVADVTGKLLTISPFSAAALHSAVLDEGGGGNNEAYEYTTMYLSAGWYFVTFDLFQTGTIVAVSSAQRFKIHIMIS